MKIFIVLLWLMLVADMINVAFDFINASNSISNFVGVILLFVIAALTYLSHFGLKILPFINQLTLKNKSKK